jgi:hypothetical protein
MHVEYGEGGGGVLATKTRCSLYLFFLQWILSGKSIALKVAFFKKNYYNKNRKPI